MPQAAFSNTPLGAAPSSYAQPERVVLRFRRSGRRLIFPIIVLIAVAAAAGFWVGALPALWENLLAAGIAALIAVVFSIAPILGWLTHRVTVTDRRLILRHGFFVRHRAEIPFSRVREVRSRRTLFQRFAGSGSIDLFVGAERTRLKDVPGVVLVAEALQELVEKNYEHSTGMMGQTGLPGSFGALGAFNTLGAGVPGNQTGRTEGDWNQGAPFGAAAGSTPNNQSVTDGTTVLPRGNSARNASPEETSPVRFW